MDQKFADRTTLTHLALVHIDSGMRRLHTRPPLTLVCDGITPTYHHANGTLFFNVKYELRATDRDGDDTWHLTCDYCAIYSFKGEPPTQYEANAMLGTVFTLVHNQLRELVHSMTGYGGMQPLILDVATFPRAA